MANDIGATLIITEAGTLAIALGAIALEDLMKIRQIKQLGPDVAQNIISLAKVAVDNSQDTMSKINEWRKKHGLEPLVAPEST